MINNNDYAFYKGPNSTSEVNEESHNSELMREKVLENYGTYNRSHGSNFYSPNTRSDDFNAGIQSNEAKSKTSINWLENKPGDFGSRRKRQTTGLLPNYNQGQGSFTNLNFHPENSNFNSSTTNLGMKKNYSNVGPNSTMDLKRLDSKQLNNYGRGGRGLSENADRSLHKINEEEELKNTFVSRRNSNWLTSTNNKESSPQQNSISPSIPRYGQKSTVAPEKTTSQPSWMVNNNNNNNYNRSQTSSFQQQQAYNNLNNLREKERDRDTSQSNNTNFLNNNFNVLDKSNITETKDNKVDLDYKFDKDDNSYFKGELKDELIEKNFINLKNMEEEIRSNLKHTKTANFAETNIKEPNQFFLDENKQDINELQLKLSEAEKVSYKLRIEKESLEDNLKNIQTQIKEDKKRYEDLLFEMDKNNKKIDNENQEIIKNLKIRHSEELSALDNRYKTQIKETNKEKEAIKLAQEEYSKKILENQNSLHKMEIEKLEKLHDTQINQMRKYYEDQVEMLKIQLNNHLDFSKLYSKVENSSQQINEVINKFNTDTSQKSQMEKHISAAKDVFLSDYESKLKYLETELVKERERLVALNKENEINFLEKKKEIQEERLRLDKENLRLQELQSAIKSLEFQSIQKYESEKLALQNKQSELKYEIENIKNEFKHKLSELEHSKKVFVEEKSYFEKYKDETLKNIENRKRELEDKRNKFLEEEKVIKGRIKVSQEKEFYLNDKLEKFEEERKAVEKKAFELEKEEKEIINAINRLEENIKNHEEDVVAFNLEKEKFRNTMLEIENDKNYLNSEKIKITQKEQEIKLRMNAIDNARINHIYNISNLSNQIYNESLNHIGSGLQAYQNNNNNYAKTANYYENNGFGNTASKFFGNTRTNNNLFDDKFNIIRGNINEDDKIMSNTLGGFKNSHDYLEKLNRKLNEKYNTNLTGDFNSYIAEEQNFLKKSMQSNFTGSMLISNDKY